MANKYVFVPRSSPFPGNTAPCTPSLIARVSGVLLIGGVATGNLTCFCNGELTNARADTLTRAGEVTTRLAYDGVRYTGGEVTITVTAGLVDCVVWCHSALLFAPLSPGGRPTLLWSVSVHRRLSLAQPSFSEEGARRSWGSWAKSAGSFLALALGWWATETL